MTVDELLSIAGELALVKISNEREIAKLNAELEALKKQHSTPVEDVEFEKNGLAICTE